MDRSKLPPFRSDPMSSHPVPDRDLAAGDEINLAQVLRVLFRRKLLIAAVLVASVVAGVAYALSIPKQYGYTTIIEIGTGRNAKELLDLPETTRAKAADGYIIQVLQGFFKDDPTQQTKYRITAEAPRSGQVVILRSSGALEEESMYVSLHNAVVERIRKDHEAVQGAIRSDLEARLTLREQALAELRNSARRFDEQIRRFEKEPTAAIRELSYYATLRLADNERAQAEMVSQIDDLRQQMAAMRSTRAAMSTTRTLEPIGLARRTVVVLAAFIGLALGIAAALMVERLSREKP